MPIDKIQKRNGEIVDFDMLDTKQQLANIPQQIEVTQRQQYVDEKSSKAKPKPGVVPEYIQNAEWNVLSTEETEHGDLEVHISSPKVEDDKILDNQKEVKRTSVKATPIRMN